MAGVFCFYKVKFFDCIFSSYSKGKFEVIFFDYN